MAKDPAFLFYSQDFLVGTMAMTMEERGQYITLLSYMHQHGRVDEKTICFLVGSVSPNLKRKFRIDENGLWYNERLELESARRAEYSKSRRINGSKGGRPKKEDSFKNHKESIQKPYGFPVDNHMGNENENEIEIENEIKEENKKVEKDQNYKLFVQAYFDWFEDRFGISPQFGVKDGAAIKTIMKYLTTEAEKAGKDADVQAGALRVWQFILQNWDNIPDDFIKTKMTKPNQIASNIDKILGYFKKSKKDGKKFDADKLKRAIEKYS